MPLDFLKRRPDDPRATSAPSAAEPLPEETPAAEFTLKLQYRAKSSEGVRLKAGPGTLSQLPALLSGLAEGHVEVVEPRPAEYQDALPNIVRPEEASQWLAAHGGLSPTARHALHILESVDAIDLSVDTFAVALLHGDLDTEGYPEYSAIVGGVASHWDEATGDLIVRGVLGWGGRGARGDTDRAAQKLLATLFANITTSQYAIGLAPSDHIPAPSKGGLMCPHCGFSTGSDRSFYCPKCGMRLLRG